MPSQQSPEEQFLNYLIASIVKNPADIRIDRSLNDMGVLLSLRVKKEDMGLIIGKAGANANAIKLLTKLAGYKNNQKVSVKIEEPN